MTDQNEFSSANYEVTAAEVDGIYQTEWADGLPVNMSFAHITADGTTAAYTYGDNFTTGVDYIVRYFSDNGNDKEFTEDETQVSAYTAPTEVGGYFMVAMTKEAENAWYRNSNYANAKGLTDAAGNTQPGVIAVYFQVTPRSLEGVTAIDGTTGSTEFTYDAAVQDVEFVLDGKVLEIGEDADYTVVVTNPSGQVVGIDGIKNAGTYNAKVSGHSGYAGQSADVQIVVNKLDLSTATVVAPDVEAYTSVSAYASQLVNGTKLSDLLGDLTQAQIQYTDENGDPHGVDDADAKYEDWALNNASIAKGGYTFRLTAEGSNTTGSTEYTINAVDTLVTDFRYGVRANNDNVAGNIDGLDGKTFNLSKGDQFDSASVYAFSDGTAMASSRYTVTPASADEPGVYTAIAQVNVPENYSIGGTGYSTFTVINGVLDPNTVDVSVSFYGKNFDFLEGNRTYPTQYTGSAVTPAVSVSCEGEALAAGTDYVVTYETAQGETVESMVDAGVYKVTIDLADGYCYNPHADRYADEVTSISFYVYVAPRVLASVYVDEPAWDEAYGNGILYTGSEITPVIKGSYNPLDGNPNDPDDDVVITLDSSWYELHGLSYKAEGSETFNTVDAIIEVGEYMVNIVPTAASANYTWDDNAVIDTFDVISSSAFSDVSSTEWYAGEVNLAKQLGYIDGMGNNLFFPNVDMSREQFAQVLYNMAGEPEVANGGVWGEYQTRFDDVDSFSWSAKAISWATEAGIVNGVSDTEFDPTGTITREQIATMLYRYAGNGAAADASVLGNFVDGDQVSDWASTAVAWAVENGYMEGRGNDDLQPQGTATRAEIAALAVRVQPEALPRA